MCSVCSCNIQALYCITYQHMKQNNKINKKTIQKQHAVNLKSYVVTKSGLKYATSVRVPTYKADKSKMSYTMCLNYHH